MASNAEPVRAFERLDGSNFENWKFRMQMLFEEKELLDMVEGVEEVPVSAPDSNVQQKYQKRQRKAYLMLAQMVADSQLVYIKDCKTGTEAWQKLHQVYESKGKANRILVKAQFDALKKLDTETMQEWFGRVQTAADRVKNTGGTCNQDDVHLKILGGLPEELRPLVMVLEALPNLSLEEMQARLLHEELRRPAGASSAGDSALMGRHGGRGGKAAGGNKREDSTDKQQTKKLTCFYCGKVGHKAEKCWKKQRDERKKRSGDSSSNSAGNASAASESVFVTGGNSVGAEKWYLDSGATRHMTREKSWFSDFQELPACPVYIGNGKALDCVGMGSIPCAMLVDGEIKDGKLKDVWYVPELSTNLLSVSCLTANGWTVDFAEQRCTIRSAAGAVAARAVKENNMYRVQMATAKNSAEAHVAATTEPAQLWHERLGHVGAARLGKLQENGDGDWAAQVGGSRGEALCGLPEREAAAQEVSQTDLHACY